MPEAFADSEKRNPRIASGSSGTVLNDRINIIDGHGTMYECTLVVDSPKGAEARIEQAHQNWGGHPYDLTMAVCPTKNIDRYEWFAEKATEFGVDRIVLGNRRTFRKEDS